MKEVIIDQAQVTLHNLKNDYNILTSIRNSSSLTFEEISYRVIFLKTISNGKKVDILKTFSNIYFSNVSQEILNHSLNDVIRNLENSINQHSKEIDE